MPSAVCLGCGARVDDDAPCACETVGGNPYRDAAPASRAQLGNCPRCGPPLAEVNYEGTPLDECNHCGGVFVEGWILDRLVEARDARLSLSLSLPIRRMHREREVRYLRCPRCSAQMNRKIFGRHSGVVVDICKSDGIWFDAGELTAVLEFIEGGGLERALRTERAEAEELAKRERRRQSIEPPVGARLMQPVPLRSQLAAELIDTLLSWWRT